MMNELHLSRICLRHDASVAALAGSLLSKENGESELKAHRLLWSLFADTPERQRDFLWRDDGGAHWHRRTFYTLSARPPEDHVRLFEVETKRFEPVLSVGQRLRFCLRASPSTNERRPGAKRGKRRDLVSVALNKLPDKGKAQRDNVTQEVGRAWLARQGERAGFRLPNEGLLRIDGEAHPRISRPGGAHRAIRFSVLDFEGVLEVTDPATFLETLSRGIGRAKAFGCGLMLIRRA